MQELTKQEKALDPWDILQRFTSYKLSPGVGLPRELVTGKTAVGEEVTKTETLSQALLPLVVGDIMDSYKTGGLGKAAWVAPLAFLGFGANTYERKTEPKKEASALYDDIFEAIEKGNEKWAAREIKLFFEKDGDLNLLYSSMEGRGLDEAGLALIGKYADQYMKDADIQKKQRGSYELQQKIDQDKYNRETEKTKGQP